MYQKRICRSCRPHVALSTELQKELGLRREEAMKFQPSYALGGFPPATADKVMIKPSWSKGGRYREIPITNDRQRELLGRASVGGQRLANPCGQVIQATPKHV